MNSYGCAASTWINYRFTLFVLLALQQASQVSREKVRMIKVSKIVSFLALLASALWFLQQPDFPALIVGIVSLAILMMTFLPIRYDDRPEQVR